MSRSSSRPESVINSINDDANSREQSNEGLPSYEDVLREEEQGITYGNPSLSQSNNHLNVPRPPQRPPQKPPRPNTSSHSTLHQHHSHHTTSSNSTSRPRPPASSSSSPHQTKPSYRPPPPTQNPSTNSRIPWVYPSNFHCPKCNNTGYKLKNGKSCRSCWRRFAPTNQINYNPGPLSSVFVTPMGMGAPPPPQPQYGYGYGYPPQPPRNQRPLVVRPGDPRLGGVICGECRGTGRVSFFLDDNIVTTKWTTSWK